tara:strand:- start:1027 stop:1524 length:498 start_codon:yes stop_codon:yes gene_type:complete
VITKKLYEEYPEKQEGYLSKKRAFIIGRSHLNLVGEEIFSESDIKNKLQKISKNIYGNTLEALVGAIYIDKGFCFAEKFILKKVYNSALNLKGQTEDYKSKLQNRAQKMKIKIDYNLVEETGPDHSKEFLVALFFNKKKISKGKGTSIKEAQQKAAEKAYNSFFN